MDNDVIFAKAWDISKLNYAEGRKLSQERYKQQQGMNARNADIDRITANQGSTNPLADDFNPNVKPKVDQAQASRDRLAALRETGGDSKTMPDSERQGAGMSGGLRNAANAIGGAVNTAREKAAPLFDAAGKALTTTASTASTASKVARGSKLGQGIKNAFSTGVGAAQAANTKFNTPENRQTAANVAGGAAKLGLGATKLGGKGILGAAKLGLGAAKGIGNFAMGNNVPQTGADMSNPVNMNNTADTGTALSTTPNNQPNTTPNNQPSAQGNQANTTTGDGNVNMNPNQVNAPGQQLRQDPTINIYGGGGGAGNMGGGAGGGSGGYGGSARQAMIDNAQAKANTRGGIGTGVMSNLATFGMSGAAKGLLNWRKRNQGKQELRNLAAVEKQLRLSSIRSSLVKEQFLTPGNRDGKAILGKVNETTETVLDEQGNVMSQTKTSKLETPSVKDKEKPQQNAPPMMKEEPWNVVENPFANPFYNPNAFALTKEKSPSIPESDILIENFLKADVPTKDEVKLSGFETNKGDDLSLLPASAFANNDTPVVDNMSLLPTGWK